ncbi:non-hydrolyzing UDP-N-acetylglucosamine 2-epimerase [Paraferrimonas haliotis]|uniref:non-hydrolyzing UDP-N-acetylglucosamine 2-epimerase n=1 Tax=Paraferrimonas haliotis TaxID=2013866 RepID=UPI000BA99A8C|nr:UDP-N-acetylglucosamine 2-epimerase (non-hydrolyzing) [Paraferrimonas haliotis]
MKVLVVFGTRPEAIKMCPLVNQLNNTQGVDVRVCVTGQHREMLDQVLSIFNITPDYDLNLMKPGQTLQWITSQVLDGVSEVIDQCQPQVVLVHGDTTTCFAASLAAYYKQVAVGHVEAGLRTHDIYSPFPEEANRKLTGALAQFHFAPTQTAADNLIREGVETKRIFITGNTVIDALLQTVKTVNSRSDLISESTQALIQLSRQKRVVLVTCHRRENFGAPFASICQALIEISELPNTLVVFPVHPNPNITKITQESLTEHANIKLIKPLDYADFVALMDSAAVILTDSGGIQEEAPSLNKPVFVLRDKTERPEAIEAGTVSLVGTHTQTIVTQVGQALADTASAQKAIENPYGDGKACQRIVAILQDQLP